MENKIDFGKPEKYQLIIWLRQPNEASFYVYSKESPDTGYYEELSLSSTSLFTESLKEAVFNNKYLILGYENTNILLASGFYTFVPEDIYRANEDEKDSFFRFNFENIDHKKILSDEVKICNIINLFEIEKTLYDFLQRTFPYARYTHYITPLLRYFSKQRIIGESGRVFIRISDRDLSVFCFRFDRIEAVNTFLCNDVNDAAYFILTLWEKLRFDRLLDGLHVAGTSDKKSELITILSRFIENVIPVSNPFPGKNPTEIPFDIQAYLDDN
ncbi:MAG: DUF3822 family protein [Candidatus Azobacteroides sp.]|nr:DUF3822 family protein [Candidatus Azobacteroides sp.]